MNQQIKTSAINLQTLCVPCGCHCRYCLLSWNNQIVGADYERSKRYAKRFHDYIQENRPEIQFDFTFGYCMEHPKLLEELDFMNALGSVQGQFLQMDGMNLRNKDQSEELISNLLCHGVKHVNFTFYGQEAYHDRFAARLGDFENLMTMAHIAAVNGLEASAGIPVTSENAAQVEDLLLLLDSQGIEQVFLFVPHEEGRGKHLSSIRFSETDFEKLGVESAQKLNRKIFRPEREWVSNIWPEEQNRLLNISLTPDNIERFENMEFDQVIRYVEALDDAYYSSLPSFQELCKLYGDLSGTRFYSKRDQFQHFQKTFY